MVRRLSWDIPGSVRWLILAFLLVAPYAALAVDPVAVMEVKVEQASPTSASLTISADGPLPSYESFSLPDPPRLVIDIPNAVHAVPQPLLARGGPVAKIRSSQYREKPVQIVRVVIDLVALLPYSLETKKDQLRVLIGEMAAEAPEVPEAPRLAEKSWIPPIEKPKRVEASRVPLQGRVTRVEVLPLAGKSRILITTQGRPSFQVIEVADPPRLVVEIAGALIAPEVPTSLDVQKLPGPVKRVRTTQHRREPEKVVRVVADLKQRTKYEVKQTEEGISLDLTVSPAAQVPPAPLKEAPPGPAQPTPLPAAAPPAPANGRLSMDFKDADINNILRIIAEVSGKNIVAGEEVKGKVTVRLTNVDWRQALEVILRVNKLWYDETDNIIRVSLQDTIQKERAEKLAAVEAEEARKRKAAEERIELEPLIPKVIPVSYAKASDIQKRLERLKTARGRMEVDDRTNSLIIEDIQAAISKMEDLLKTLDTPTPQVLIEARIVEATRDFSKGLGIAWGGAGRFTGAGPSPITTIFGSVGGAAVTAPTISPFSIVPLFVNFPIAGAPALGFTFGTLANNLLLGAQLSLSESEGKTKTLSSPRVVTLDNEEAEIRQGTQVPFTTIDASGRTVVSFIDAFIKLKVRPHITADGRVSMKVEAEKSEQGTRIDFAGGFAFPIDTQKATTNVLVSSGSTIVIGGLHRARQEVRENRIPFFSRIPLLGNLFKSRAESMPEAQNRELLIFLTPTILPPSKSS